MLPLKDWLTNCNVPRLERLGWLQDFKPCIGKHGWQPLVCSVNVQDLSCGHGTQFNKGQIGVNYKVSDLMQKKNSKVIQYNGIIQNTTFFLLNWEIFKHLDIVQRINVFSSILGNATFEAQTLDSYKFFLLIFLNKWKAKWHLLWSGACFWFKTYQK